MKQIKWTEKLKHSPLFIFWKSCLVLSGPYNCSTDDNTEPSLRQPHCKACRDSAVLQPWSGPCMPSPRGTQKALFVPSFVVANKTQKIPAEGTSVCHLSSWVRLSSWALFRCLNSENEATVNNNNNNTVHPPVIGGRDFQFHAGNHTVD